MNKNKIKILHCSETSGAYSGFGLYSRELFTRLVQNDRFELAELASFGTVSDDKSRYALQHGWKYYPAAVEPNDPRWNEYNSNPEHKHGSWRFERTCLDFKPDIVFDVRDPWNMLYQYRSPFRDFYHWVISPTVDSYPQQDEWMTVFMNADGVFTYSDFGLEVLREQSNNQIKLQRAIYCGADLNVFRPMDKLEIRKKLGLPEDAFIIGTTMRNQVRKLYPDLFRMFAKMINEHKDDPIVQKTYLYVHTSYPDLGWEIAELLRDNGISNRVYFSYICNDTRKPIVSLYEGIRTYSAHSHSIGAKFPNVVFGYETEHLAEVYNTFDLYLQYASNEGLGIPMIEAASCGIPLAGIDYSAMSDNIRLTGGIPLSNHLNFILDTKAYRAVPDVDKNIQELLDFMHKNETTRKDMGVQARKAAEQHFDWDKNAKVWSDYFENVELKNRNETWDSPRKSVSRNFPPVPQGLSNVKYVEWLCHFIAKKPNLVNNIIGINVLKQLNDGTKKLGQAFAPVTRESLYNDFKTMGEQLLLCEDARFLELEEQDYIQFANSIRR